MLGRGAALALSRSIKKVDKNLERGGENRELSGLLENRERRAQLPDALIRASLQHPWGILSAWLLVFLLATPGLIHLEVETSTDSVLDRSHPEWAIYQGSQDLFGGDELLVVALHGNSPMDPDLLDHVESLTTELEDLDGIRRVDSLSSVPVIGLNADGSLNLESSLIDAPIEPEERRQHVRQRLRGDRIAPKSLVSDDQQTLAINILLSRGQEDRHKEIIAEVKGLISSKPAIISGVPIFRVVASERTHSEILQFVPITAMLIAVLVWIFFRSLLAVCLSFLPGFLGSWLMLSAMGYSGAPLSITTMILPSVMLALGCAYAMHPLVAVSGTTNRNSRAEKDRQTLPQALYSISLPLALSGLTTSVGFLSITFVRIEAVQSTGLYGAIGVLAVTLLSLTVLPACLQLSKRIWPYPLFFSRRERMAETISEFSKNRKKTILSVWSIAVLLAVIGIFRVEVETDATRWLPRGHEVRDHYEEIRKTLSGISPMNIIITAPEGQSVLEPKSLHAINQLTVYLESRDDIGRALAITDPLRQLGGSLLEDPNQPLPKSAAAAEQLLLLLSSVEQIDDLITLDRNTTNIILRADNNGSASLRQVARDAEVWWQQNGPAEYTVKTTGIMYEFARAQDEIAYGQMKGLAVALLVISLILFAIFRWPALAAVSVIPNLVPLLMIFGTLGLLGLPLDAGTVLIGCLALGIAVDDTIHIATNFDKHCSGGEDPVSALKLALPSVIPAISATTLIIGVGFTVIGFSEFTITRNLGLLTASVMGLCLLADLTLLPTLLANLGAPPQRNKRKNSETPLNRAH